MANAKIELLAPARDLETGRVAVDCGADAVYVGGPGFGARHEAGNSVEDVAALVRYAHIYGVRVYAALNTVVMEDELSEAQRIACELLDAGVDALIVQDTAYLRMSLDRRRNSDPSDDDACGKDTAKAVEFHASTQMSNISPADIAFWGQAGFRRVILERALSLDEIRAIRAAAGEDVELEVFVHGAICVGYSGRCFMSRATDNNRSGNRGNCSQPCRLAYDLVDGNGEVLIKGKHLLSVRDMDLSSHLGELLDAGVTSFKIEGRLKDAGYVRNVVSHYRRLLDEAISVRRGFSRSSVGVSVPDFEPDPSKSFTRGATDYFLGGNLRYGKNVDGHVKGADEHGENVDVKLPVRSSVSSFDTPKVVGEPVGQVERTGCDRTGNRWFTLACNLHATVPKNECTLAAGDGICFFTTEESLQGTNVNRVEAGRVYPDKMDGIGPGMRIFRNYDHVFNRTLRHSRMKRRIRVTVKIEADESRVSAVFTDETGFSVAILREGRFEEARGRAKMLAVMRAELAKSGDTIFEVGEVEVREVEVGKLRFIPVSMLADIRRDGLGRLTEVRAQLVSERCPATEDMTARFPREKVSAVENVTNTLAAKFYLDHGVREIEPALELRPVTDRDEVMRTRYCIRREIGRCLRDEVLSDGLSIGDSAESSANETGQHRDLFLVRGNNRYRLCFDCARCEMAIKKI